MGEGIKVRVGNLRVKVVSGGRRISVEKRRRNNSTCAAAGICVKSETAAVQVRNWLSFGSVRLGNQKNDFEVILRHTLD